MLFWNCWYLVLSLDLHSSGQQVILEGRDRTEVKWDKKSLWHGTTQSDHIVVKGYDEGKWGKCSTLVMKMIPLAKGGGRLEVAGQENLVEGNIHTSADQAP